MNVIVFTDFSTTSETTELKSQPNTVSSEDLFENVSKPGSVLPLNSEGIPCGKSHTSISQTNLDNLPADTYSSDGSDSSDMYGLDGSVTIVQISSTDDDSKSYQMPDENETNPDILRAEAMAISTPTSLEFAADIYDSLIDIQDSCSVDASTYCDDGNALSSIAIPFSFIARDMVRDFQTSIITSSLTESNLRGSRKLLWKDQSNKDNVGGNNLEDSDSDSDSDEEYESDTSDWNSRKRHDHEQNGRYVKEDSTFNGALGFGKGTDACLYQNFDILSSECQIAITNHAEIRQNYWNAVQWNSNPPPRPHHGVFFHLFLWFLVGFACIRYFKYRKVRETCRDIIYAIDANKDLKAAVEVQTGLTMPKLPPRKDCVMKIKSILWGMLIVFLSFLVAIFVSISSLVITVNITDHLGHVDKATGEKVGPSAIVSLTILFLVCACQIYLIVMIKKTCLKECSQNEINATSENNSGNNNILQNIWGLVPTIPENWRFRRSNRNVGDSYSLLNGESTEMVGMSRHGTQFVVMEPHRPTTTSTFVNVIPSSASASAPLYCDIGYVQNKNDHTAVPVSYVRMI